jgi:hypothetical protein
MRSPDNLLRAAAAAVGRTVKFRRIARADSLPTLALGSIHAAITLGADKAIRRHIPSHSK